MKKRIKTNGYIIFFSVILIVIFPDKFIRFSSGMLDSLVSILGLALLLCGIMMRIISRGYKSENSAGGMFLVQGGPYALVRNPMYLGILFIGLGVILACFKWWLLPVFLAVLVIRYLTLVFKEEKLLSAAFRKEYTDYCARVPRLFPRFKMLFAGNMSRFLPLKLKWVKKEANSIIPIICAIFALRIWAWIRTQDIVIFLPQIIGMVEILVVFMILAVYLAKKNEIAAVENKDR